MYVYLFTPFISWQLDNDAVLITSTTKETTTTAEKIPVPSYPEDLEIDWSSSKVTKKSTGEVMSVADAVRRGLLDSDLVERLAEEGITRTAGIHINWDEGTITDKTTQESMTIDTAERKGFIDRPTAQALRVISGQWEEKDVKSQHSREAYSKMMSDMRREDQEMTTTETTRTISEGEAKPLRSSTPKQLAKPKKVLRDFIHNETFDMQSFFESVRTDTLNTDESLIVNPQSGQVMTVTEAIEHKVFDAHSGHIIHTDTNERISLQEAVYQGLIPAPGQLITRTIQSGFVSDRFENVLNTDKEIHTSITADLKTSITEPVQRPKGMTFKEAIERNLVDQQSGTFYNPLTDEVISLATAIEYGWISESGTTEVKVEPDRYYEKTVVVNQKSPADAVRKLTFTQALDQGFIDLSKNQYTEPSTGAQMAILDAIRGNFIETIDKEETYDAGAQGMTLSAALESKAFDEQTGLFVKQRTKEKITLSEAIKQGYIDGESSLYDVNAGRMYTLNEAIAKGKIDSRTGQYIENPKSKMSVKDAAKMGFVALVGAPFMAIKFAARKKEAHRNEDVIDMSSLRRKGVKKEDTLTSDLSSAPVTIEATKVSILNPQTIEVTQVRELSSVTAKDSDKMMLMEAISSGYLNPENGMFKDPDTGKYMTLQNAIHLDHIHTESAKLQLKNGIFVNIGEAIDSSVLDNTGHYSEDGIVKTLEDLIQEGRVQEVIPDVHAASSLVMKTIDKINVDAVLDPRSNTLVSLSSAIDTGLINPHDGTYTNPVSGEVMSIMDALTFSYIQGQVKDSISVKEGLSKEGFEAEVTFSEKKKVKVASVLDTNTGAKLSLHDAIRQGIIDETEGRYVDKRSGKIMPISDAMNEKLVAAKELSASMQTSQMVNKSSENVFTQTQSFDISQVVDPVTGKDLSVPQAIEKGVLNVNVGIVKNLKTGEEVTISDAIQKGFIKGNQTTRKSGIFSDTLPKQYIHEKDTVHLKSVYNKDEGRFISVKQAIDKGIIDEEHGLYFSDDRTSMPISKAISDGLIQTELKQITSGNEGIIQEKKSFTIHTVIDPVTGRKVSASEAIDRGLLNLTSGIYNNPATNEKLTIPEAVDRGFVEADTSTSSLPQPTVLKPTSVQVDLGRKAFTVKSILDPRTQEGMSVTEAVSRGILDQSMSKYLDTHTGQTMPLRDAAKRGLVIMEEVKEGPVITDVVQESLTVTAIVDPTTGKDVPLEKAVKKGMFDPDKGLVQNKLSGKMISLDDAVKQGLAKVEASDGITSEEIIRGIIVEKVKDPMTGRDLKVTEAKRRGILNSESGYYFDHRTNTRMTIEDALQNELIQGRKSAALGTTDKQTRDIKQINVSQVLDTRTGVEISLDDAVQRGIVDSKLTTYTDPRTGQHLALEDAMKEGLVSGSVSVMAATKTKFSAPKTSTTFNITSVTDTMSGQKLTVAEALNKGILGPTGQFIDTKTSDIMPVSEAFKRGLVETESIPQKSKSKVKIEESSSGEAPIPFKQALKAGYINGIEGTFTSPYSSRYTSVDDAVLSESVVSDSGKPFKYKAPQKDRVTYSFQQAFKSGLIDPDTGLFWDVKKGKSYSVEEALKKGYLSPLATSKGKEGSVFMLKAGTSSLLKTDIVVKEEPYTESDGFKRDAPSPITGLPKDVVERSSSPTVRASTPDGEIRVSTPADEIRASTPDDITDGTVELNGDHSLYSQDQLTLTGALQAGLVNKTGEYCDPDTNDVLGIDEAVICGFLKLDQPQPLHTLKLNKNLEEPAALSKAIKEGHINLQTGNYTEPRSKETVTVQQAIQLGYIQPKTTDTDDSSEEKEQHPKTKIQADEYVIMTEGAPFAPKHELVFKDGKLISRTATEVVVNQGSCTYVTKPGFCIDSAGHVVNTNTGERMSLEEAMQSGIADIEAAEGTGTVRRIGAPMIPPVLDDGTDSDSGVRFTW